MKFPGQRKHKHYFPVSERGRIAFDEFPDHKDQVYIVGIDQLLVDIEVHVGEELLEEYGLEKGQSFVLDEDDAREIYQELRDHNKIVGEYAGGAIGNTLHNYSVLSDDKCYALGCIPKNIQVGDYAFRYISTTNSHVDLTYLQPVNGDLGRAICFVTPDGERSFGVAKGAMNNLSPKYINSYLIKNAALLLISAFTLRDPDTDIYKSTIKACKVAKENGVPVVFSLGTSFLIEESLEFYTEFIREYVTVLAMNDKEALALTGEEDFLLSIDKALELCDMVLMTVGEKGLYIGSHVEASNARKTQEQIHSKSIPEYNKYEYSRAQKKSTCINPIKIFTHTNPFLGGPGTITNTNGAGDAALSALLHDMSANRFHKETVPNSPKHELEYLTYSSISQICRYANRVSYEVLVRNSPRLTRALPQKEECLEEAYWDLR